MKNSWLLYSTELHRFGEAETLSKEHILKRILDSQAPVMSFLKKLMLVLLIFLGIANLRLVIQSLDGPYLYLRDIVQEYLMAKAILADVDPYLPLPELFTQFIGPIPTPILPHPTPHPPAAAFLGLFLSKLFYKDAVVIWLIFEIVLVFVAAFLFLIWIGKRPTVLSVALFGGIFLAWRPFLEELLPGQLMILLLVLLLSAGIAFQSNKQILGGCLLGCTIALKLITWPLFLFLLLRRKWRAVVAAGAVAVFLNLAAGAWAGFDTLFRYYLEIGSSVLPLYRYQAYNFSIGSIGWRFFEGTLSQVIIIMESPPLIFSPFLARFFAYGMSLAVLLMGLWGATRVSRFDLGFAMIICVSVLISPVVWSHYFVLLLIPLGVVWTCLSSLKLPERLTNLSLILIMTLSVPNTIWIQLVSWIAGQQHDQGVSMATSFSAGLITFIPTLAIVGLLFLLWRISILMRICNRLPSG